MERYNLYCTKEQAERAYKLGAPIKELEEFNAVPACTIGLSSKLYEIPNAEQMIGWLEEQGLAIDTEWSWGGQVTIWVWYNPDKEHVYTSHANSRKEATIAAIDAALEYLEDNDLIK